MEGQCVMCETGGNRSRVWYTSALRETTLVLITTALGLSTQHALLSCTSVGRHSRKNPAPTKKIQYQTYVATLHDNALSTPNSCAQYKRPSRPRPTWMPIS